ncbi:MAG: hypothetical protein IT425_12480, partial [Pirellulales bacterium]|nr:hypothetical protein [Pirellulales bacterium]
MANESRIATVARKLLLVALGVSACCSASLLKWDGLFAAEPASQRLQESPLEYRRVYVPADHPDSWPRGEAKYIPLERTDFEAWMAEANRSVNELLTTPIIDSAEYQAWLGEDDQLQGRGSWKISMTATTPALMPMVPLSFVMNDPRWQEDHSQLARLGHWGTSGKQAVSPGLQVPKAGVLEFEWSLRAQTTGQDPQFIWKTPPATRIRLTIDLPADKEPRIDGASVLRMETLPSRGDTEKPATRRWVLSLASAGNDVLRFARAGKDLTNGQPTSNAESLNPPAPPSIQESVKYRESVEYEFQSRGLQTRYRWRLESNEELPRELSATLVPGMQLVEVTRGGDEQSWRVVRGIAPAPDRVIISISPQQHSEGVEIELTTWQALQLDSAWKLPVLRPDHVVWSGGDFMLELPKEFELRSLVPTDCQQSGIEGPTAARPGRESLSLIEYSPSAALDVLVSRRSAQSVVQSYTTLALTESEATGKLVSKWKVSNGSLFKLCGALGPGWTLDAVETTPSNALAEWYVVRNGDRRLIEIALTEGATPERDITVTLAGRLNQLPGSELLPLNALRILEWQDARVDHHWLSLQTAEPFGAEPLGGLRQIDKRTAADADNPWDDLVEAGG